MTVMSRQALFAAVWKRPLTDLAAEFGVTDVGLRKICDRHEIPTPRRGYWAQVRAGKTFPQPQLRAVTDPRKEQVLIAGGRPLPPVVAEAMKQARAAPQEKATRAKPAAQAWAPPAAQDERGRAEPLKQIERQELVATAKALSKAREDGDGFASISGGAVVPPADRAPVT